jgi:hypothetical protein
MILGGCLGWGRVASTAVSSVVFNFNSTRWLGS